MESEMEHWSNKLTGVTEVILENDGLTDIRRTSKIFVRSLEGRGTQIGLPVGKCCPLINAMASACFRRSNDQER